MPTEENSQNQLPERDVDAPFRIFTCSRIGLQATPPPPMIRHRWWRR
jgi:hypothetical protein